MANLKAPWLTWRTNQDGSRRFFFQPRSSDRAAGWAALRLHDEYERPIRDQLAAADACRKLADIYTRWRNGEDGFGPHLIDRLGRIVSRPADANNRKGKRGPAPKVLSRKYKPGQIGAMMQDYMGHDIFAKELKATTRANYKSYLITFAEEFGETYWPKLAPGLARKFILEHARKNGLSGAHSMYRTVRAFFGDIRLCYDDVDHPGFVPENANPLTKLKLSLPDGEMLPWPREAVEAFVALADREGNPSIGDAIVMVSWLGVRRQDWLKWPANFFDKPLIAFRQEKTSVPNVLPWEIVPALADRIRAAIARRQAQDAAVTSASFFTDRDGRPWKNEAAFRKVFNELRNQLALERPTFATRYYVGLVEGDPLAIPTRELAMRQWRHTCVTLNFDAQVPPHLIGGITGHSQDEIDDILRHYRARTADQAEAALQIRLAHEATRTKGATA